jgi:MFS family permease
MNKSVSQTFRALQTPNYRKWAAGALVSNIGTWMQRIAQDWLVLTILTDHNATAVGIVMALQFGPSMFMFPLTGYVADHFNRRKTMLVTQAIMGTLALVLGVLVFSGLVQLWHVYVLAGMLGVVAAFDAPVRQVFVSEMVEEKNVSNAVALNATSFNAARMIGPAVAGLLIEWVGIGWVFLLNVLSFAGVIGALLALKASDLHTPPQSGKSHNFMDGIFYIAKRRDLMILMSMLFLVGALGLNFAIFISTMSASVFHAGAGGFGMLSAMSAIGTVTGALMAAHKEKPSPTTLVRSSLLFGCGLVLAAVMPTQLMFGLVMIPVGMAAQTFTTTANGLTQLGTSAAMRGQVMAIYMAILMGTTIIGAPVVGQVVDILGPRWGIGVGALGCFLAALVGLSAPEYRLYKGKIDRNPLEMASREDVLVPPVKPIP